jgi:putative thioredoxin
MSEMASPYIIDVTDQTFSDEVIEKSKTVPVVVDFWATWCAPCRMLGPVLEKLATEANGDFILAKIDVDRNQYAARQYHVQGIPAVKAFYDGRVINEFTGALPESQVRDFLETIKPSHADIYTKQGFEWEMSDQLLKAEASYRGALEEKRDHYPAMIGLGRMLLKQGKIEDGMELLQRVPKEVPERRVADTLIATSEFMQEANGQNEAELRAKITVDSADVPSRYALACLLASQERFIEAFDEFLEVVRRNRQHKEGGARKAMLALFTIIGEDEEITHTYRRRLANALF